MYINLGRRIADLFIHTPLEFVDNSSCIAVAQDEIWQQYTIHGRELDLYMCKMYTYEKYCLVRHSDTTFIAAGLAIYWA